MPAVIIAILQAILQFAPLAPELIQEVQGIISGLDPNNPALTPAQEQTLNDALTQIHNQVQNG